MLDFALLASQMEQMLDDPTSRAPSLNGVFALSRQLCKRSESDSFNGTIADALSGERVPKNWHPAQLLDDSVAPNANFQAPNAPDDYRVAASDGSQIYADAHQISDCYLLHISAIELCYGGRSSAQMSATPHFFWNGMLDDWHDAASKSGSIVVRELIDARRHVAELDELARLLEAQSESNIEYSNLEASGETQNLQLQNGEVQSADSQNGNPHSANRKNDAAQLPMLGMSDGIFDLRVSSQQSWRDWAQEENNRVLDRLRNCGQPICGYIAASRATDVVTALRVLANEWNENAEGMDEFARLSDARLFDELLPIGARSATFLSRRNLPAGASQSSTGSADSSRHQTCFFYLKIENGNVARLEFPIWVAQNAVWLDTIHALTLAQIERGNGYPIALMEAHEHAVVRSAEREAFYSLLEELMLCRGISAQSSSKNRSKMRPLV